MAQSTFGTPYARRSWSSLYPEPERPVDEEYVRSVKARRMGARLLFGLAVAGVLTLLWFEAKALSAAPAPLTSLSSGTYVSAEAAH
ncbi:MAG TPA: hypothetical protein VFQ61_11695 [Polyangiaceae bacterium]|nr:hypothetical protein [Polyangiaceae bacterium]